MGADAGSALDADLTIARLDRVRAPHLLHLIASLLKLRAAPLRVSETENASGGYRPGPLRNAPVLARMIDLG